MDDRLQTAIDNALNKDQYLANFERIFKKVFGIKPDVEDIDGTEILAHGETWAIDPTGTLLWHPADGGHDGWRAVADVEEFVRLRKA